jgi:hypothetical protein
MFNHRYQQQPSLSFKPKDTRHHTPLTKFVYINLGISHEMFRHQSQLNDASWDLILQHINLGAKLKKPTDDTTAYAKFYNELAYDVFDDFDAAIAYLSAVQDGLIIKIETPSNNAFHLENIEWVYLLSNQLLKEEEKSAQENLPPLAFSFFRNDNFNTHWQKIWEKFQASTFSLAKLLEQAKTIHAATTDFLEKHPSDLDSEFKLDPKLAKSRSLAESLLNFSNIAYEQSLITPNLFVFFTGAYTLLKEDKNNQLKLANVASSLKQLYQCFTQPAQRKDPIDTLNYRS